MGAPQVPGVRALGWVSLWVRRCSCCQHKGTGAGVGIPLRGRQQAPAQGHPFLSLCKANPPPLPKWLLADIYPGESRIRPAESLPPCPHGNRCGMLGNRAPRSSNSGSRSSSPVPWQKSP